MPLPSVSISNVPVNYFLDGVDAAKPAQGTQDGKPVGSTDQEHPKASAEGSRAGELVQKLDVLMLKAAAASTKSLDGETVKSSLQKLVDDGALDKNSLKLLAKTADKAASTLKALDKFTGAEIAAAVKPGENGGPSTLDPSSKAGKAVKEAMEAQLALSDMLAQLDKKLDAVARHEQEMKAAHPNFRGVDVNLQNTIVEFRQLCDRRATEINRMAFQMHAFGVHLAAEGRNADPNVRAILDAKVADILPRQALAMHGTADALTTINEEVAGKLRPLAERIDAFKKNPTATLAGEEFFALQTDIRTMKAAIHDIRKNGVAVGGGRVIVAADITKALEKELAKADARFSTAQKDVAARIRSEVFATTAKLLTMTPDAEYDLKGSPYEPLLKARDAYLQKLDNLVQALNDGRSPPMMQRSVNEMLVAADNLRKEGYKVLPHPGIYHEPTLKLIGIARNIDIVIKKVEIVNIQLTDADRFVTGKEAMSLFEGKLSVSSVVEARARGLDDGDVDPANEDSNIVGDRRLGAGAAGTVFELTRSDGVKVVFKGETESRTGLATICAGCGDAYEQTQQTVNLNIAAKNAADKLGCGHQIVKYSAGAHNGTFGFYMDKASGLTAGSIAQKESTRSPEDGLSGKEISKLPTAQRRQVKADLMRELNRLQWLDIVTGQMDRHLENYFIHVDRETHKVTVKDIDNDAGFTQLRVGVAKYALDASNSDSFRDSLADLAQKIDKHNSKAELAKLLRDPGVAVDPMTQKITVDATKAKNPAVIAALKHTLGVQSVSVPDKIDRTVYDALMAIKNDPVRRAEYLDSIRGRLSPESFAAAESRLDDAIAHAEQLGKDDKVVDGDGWLDQDEVPLEPKRIELTSIKGKHVKLDAFESAIIHITTCPSYFARDGLDKLFA